MTLKEYIEFALDVLHSPEKARAFGDSRENVFYQLVENILRQLRLTDQAQSVIISGLGNALSRSISEDAVPNYDYLIINVYLLIHYIPIENRPLLHKFLSECPNDATEKAYRLHKSYSEDWGVYIASLVNHPRIAKLKIAELMYEADISRILNPTERDLQNCITQMRRVMQIKQCFIKKEKMNGQ